VFVAAHDPNAGELAGHQAGLAAILHLYQAVDLRRIRHRARDGEFAVDRIHQHLLHACPLWPPGVRRKSPPDAP
jgi:hypothetical protein